MNFKCIVVLILIITIYITLLGCEIAEPSVVHSEVDKEGKIELQDIKDFIIKASSLRYELSSFVETDKIIGQYGMGSIYEIKGEYATYEKVLELMGEFFSTEVIDIELEKENLVNLNGKIGYIAASGENMYSITDESEFKLLVDDVEKKVVEVEKFGNLMGETKEKYILKTDKDGKWTIVKVEYNYDYQYVKPEIQVYITEWNKIESSSTLTKHPVKFATDSSKDTSWSEGVEDDGIGEWIKFESSNEEEISGIKIINGYAETEELYYENNRVKKIKIEFSDGSYLEKELEDDQLFWYQEIMFNEKVKTKYVKITILDVYKGTKYRETCIAEVIVFN